MENFELYDLDARFFSQKMRDIFRSLVDVDVEGTETGYLKSIPSNYGYVFFYFGFPDEEVLAKHYNDYVSKYKLREIEEARKKRIGHFILSDYIKNDLFQIAYDHPDVIGGGLAEVYLAILNADFENVSIETVISNLKILEEKLEKLDAYGNTFLRTHTPFIDHKIRYSSIAYADLDASYEEFEALKFGDVDFVKDANDKHLFRREGWEILLHIDFDGDDTLQEVIERIDNIISPIKTSIDTMIRYGDSFYPF